VKYRVIKKQKMSIKSSQGPASFVTKPPRGWLHPDHLFARDGINYAVRYLGCVEVNTSMKVLDFETRSDIAKECINRVCEASANNNMRRRGELKISNMLGEKVTVSRASANVQLTITSMCLRLSDLDTGRVIHQHEMPNISFASGGDSDTLDYIAYVAKDGAGGRACYVLECTGGLAQDVITTIGQAFELRFKEFLKKSGSNKPPPLPTLHHSNLRPDDPEYYNDLPGKEPPVSTSSTTSTSGLYSPGSSNLIDFSSDSASLHSKPEYVNTDPDARARHRDPFDMSPFALNPPGGGLPSPGLPLPPSQQPGHVMSQRSVLAGEDWFHGPISRKDAEQLLRQDGDFLVRESLQTPGQYVLTGMQGMGRKHLLLVDPNGVVRTRDRTFESVSHLIDYHRNNNLPIISAESALRLDNPVRKHSRR